MGTIVNTLASADVGQDMALSGVPNEHQLENIKTHLDLIMTALESLTKINSESLLKAAGELNLQDTISDQLSILLLPQSNPSRKKLDIEEARSLVLITSHLAKQESELIRRAVILLEQVISQNQEPHLTTLLGDYLASFSNAYRERMADGKTIASGKLTQLALKLLIDLLFYSSPQGHRRLWFALLQS